MTSHLIPVDDPADPRLEPYRDVKERDLVGRRGLFIAEGEVVLNCLLRSAYCRPQSILIARRHAGRLEGLLATAPDNASIYVAEQAVMDAVAGFDIHRGILAVGRRPERVAPADLLAGLERKATVLVLSGIANHDNMGGLFRNAAAFGCAAVLLDARCCDPLYRKAIRVSVGAALLTPFSMFEAGDDILAVLNAARFEALALSPAGAEQLHEVAPPDRCAVVMGAEGPGLADDLMARARTVRIDMAGGFDSLNVATTARIVLHHVTRGRK